ncbi:MAG: leucine/isoleucine/valine-binding protein [Desulfobulbaceae bacterium]|nr:MAG: leucine/isoleucine/valine-binding protein [Desulfobulbaceae bacterium]
MTSYKNIFIIIPVLLCTIFTTSHANQEVGNRSPILLGQSCVLTGPAKDLGIEMRGGLIAAFAKANEEGGIQGREILLKSKDDGYEPDKAIKNTLEFITEDQVFMLIGEVGTPTSKAVIPLVEKNKIPFFAPFTGAEFLRNPFRKYVINIRASYFQEMERLASYLIGKKKLTRIACFYQNDSYGFAGLQGIKKALAKRNMELVSTGSYERNTVAVMGAINDIYKASPEAVVLVGAYSACAEFIKLSENMVGKDIIFGNISFVGTDSLKETLGSYGANVVVTQVVPIPQDGSLPIIQEYQEAMKKYQHDVPISFTSLEGYIAGTLFHRIAQGVEGALTREKFIDTMQNQGRFELGGLTLNFGKDDHQGLDTVYLTRIYPKTEEIE